MRSGKCVAWHADDARADGAKRAAQLDGSAASYSGGRWRLAVSIVALLAALLLALGHAGAAAASACPSSWKTVEHEEGGITCARTYPSPGSYVLEVPEGVTELRAAVAGANGGSWGKTFGTGRACEGTEGGIGGIVDGALKVKKEELLNVVVGGEGGEPNKNGGAAGGTPGGGAAGGGPCASGGGGGSFVFGPKGLLLAAGGGGGGGTAGGSAEGSTVEEDWTEGLPTKSGEFSSNGDDFYCNGYSTETCPEPGNPQGGGEGSVVPGDPCSELENHVKGYQFYGKGATEKAAGEGGKNAITGEDGEEGQGPASSSTSPGTGGAGGAGAHYGPTQENEEGEIEQAYSPPGGGGGGGYYGGGGGSNGCGGGAGSDYWSKEVIAPHYPEFPARGVYETGDVAFSFVPPAQGIAGKVLAVGGEQPIAGVTVRVIAEPGEQIQEEGTSSEGHYFFSDLPGKYRVEAVPKSLPAGADEFHAALCEGEVGTTKEGLTYCEVTVQSEKEVRADFNAGFYLTGKVVNTGGKRVAGAVAVVKDTGATQPIELTTDSEGEFRERIAPGTAVVSVKPVGGEEFFPVESKECKVLVGGASCEVELQQDRFVEFEPCVLPNPNGEPLPPNTPEPIPGAKTSGQLEAVGCWVPQNQTPGHEATIYHSEKPVRLDGVDVDPLPGTVLQLETNSGPTVTSNGPAKVLIGGWPIIGGLVPAFHVSLNYQGSSPLSVSDQGAGTGPLAANLFGLPLSIGPGGPLGYGLPFTEGIGQVTINGKQLKTGQTTISAGVQFTNGGLNSILKLPKDTHGTWDAEAGAFKDVNERELLSGNSVLKEAPTVPSVGFGGSLVLTNRLGLTGKFNVSLNDVSTKSLFPFPVDKWDDGEIQGVTLAYTPSQDLWEFAGMFKMPTALSKLAGEVFVKGNLQKPIPPGSNGQIPERFSGYKLQSFEIQLEHIKSQTIVIPGLGEVRESGIPLFYGLFWQSGGVGWNNNLNTNTTTEVKATMGLSYGPEVNVQVGSGLKGTELSLLRMDLEGALQPNTPETPYWIYKLGGRLTLARLSPFEMEIAGAKVTLKANPEKPELDFHGQAGISFLGAGCGMEVNGQAERVKGKEESELLLEGTGTCKILGEVRSLDVILNNWLLGVCATENGLAGGGFTLNLTEPFGSAKPGCNLGSFKHPNGAASATVHRTEHLRLAHGLVATTLALHGSSGPPSVQLSGPGASITASPSRMPHLVRGAIVYENSAQRTTYVDLRHPHAGRWTIRTLPGSPAISQVLEARPRPTPHVRAKVARSGCSDALRYRLKSTDGDRILVYAQQGESHVHVGELHAGTHTLKFEMLNRLGGRGKLVAYLFHGSQPVGVQTLGTFANSASNGSERPSHISSHGGTLRWHAACDAAGYKVTIKRGKSSTQETATQPQLKLPAGHGQADVTVTAISIGGAALGSARRTVR
jgi:hypothetical protein